MKKLPKAAFYTLEKSVDTIYSRYMKIYNITLSDEQLQIIDPIIQQYAERTLIPYEQLQQQCFNHTMEQECITMLARANRPLCPPPLTNEQRSLQRKFDRRAYLSFCFLSLMAVDYFVSFSMTVIIWIFVVFFTFFIVISTFRLKKTTGR